MDAVQEARRLLPWWAVWGPALLAPLAAFALAHLGTRLALWWPLAGLRAAAGKPWPERARAAYPVGQVTGQSPFHFSLLFGVLAWLLMGRLTPVPFPLLVVLVAGAAFLGASLAGFLAQLTLWPGRIGWRDWPRGLLHFLAFNGGIVTLLAALLFMPPRMDAVAWAVFAVSASLVLFFAVGGGLLLARWAGLIQPAPERLREAVRRVAERAGRKMPEVLVLDMASVNAYAVMFLGWLLFTRECEQTFADAELEAIIGHELAHLAEPPLVLLGRLGPSLATLPLLAAWPLYSTFGMWGVLSVMGAVVAVAWLAGFLSRRMERVADEAAKKEEGDEGTYARALERLHEANLAPVAFPGRGTTHPHLYDRLVAAGAPPEYPRPRPPSRWSGSVPPVLVLYFIALSAMSPLWLSRFSAEPGVRAALYGPWSIDLQRAGTKAGLAGDWDKAAAFHGAARASDPASAVFAALEASALALAGRCDEAEAALAEAERRWEAKGSPWSEAWPLDGARTHLRRCRGGR